MRDDVPGERRDADVVLGDDWIAPDSTVEKELQASRARRGLFSLNRSPLTRKIITFNLIALNVLVAGILYLNSSRDTLAVQRSNAMLTEAELIADIFEAQLPRGAPVSLASSDGIDVSATVAGIDLRAFVEQQLGIIEWPLGRFFPHCRGPTSIGLNNNVTKH